MTENDKIIRDNLGQLAIQEQALQDAMNEAGQSLAPYDDDDDEDDDDIYYGMDSFDSDWLRLVQDIRNEEEEVEVYDGAFQLTGSGDTQILYEKNSTNLRA